MPEQFVQIYIPAITGQLPSNTYYPCNLNGRFKAKVAGFTFVDNTLATDNRMIKLTSSCFRMLYGSFPQTLLFSNQTTYEHKFKGDLPFEIEAVGGAIDITLSASTAYVSPPTANSQFSYAILTLVVEPIH